MMSYLVGNSRLIEATEPRRSLITRLHLLSIVTNSVFSGKLNGGFGEVKMALIELLSYSSISVLASPIKISNNVLI